MCIRDSNRTREQLKEGLDVWINLHIREKISGTLLILSRAFYFVGEPEDANATYNDMQIRGLELTMSSLPDKLLNEAELHFSKEAATNKQRLEVLQEQEELIEDEAEQERKSKRHAMLKSRARMLKRRKHPKLCPMQAT